MLFNNILMYCGIYFAMEPNENVLCGIGVNILDYNIVISKLEL